MICVRFDKKYIKIINFIIVKSKFLWFHYDEIYENFMIYKNHKFHHSEIIVKSSEIIKIIIFKNIFFGSPLTHKDMNHDWMNLNEFDLSSAIASQFSTQRDTHQNASKAFYHAGTLAVADPWPELAIQAMPLYLTV